MTSDKTITSLTEDQKKMYTAWEKDVVKLEVAKSLIDIRNKHSINAKNEIVKTLKKEQITNGEDELIYERDPFVQLKIKDLQSAKEEKKTLENGIDEKWLDILDNEKNKIDFNIINRVMDKNYPWTKIHKQRKIILNNEIKRDKLQKQQVNKILKNTQSKRKI